MRENNFEKNIAKEMDSLRLRPSDAVWEQVEREIRRKKRRRVVIFFSLFAALGLLGYSSYYFLSSTTSNKNTSVTSNNNPGNLKEEKSTVPGTTDTRATSVNGDNKSFNDKNSLTPDGSNTSNKQKIITDQQGQADTTTTYQPSITIKEQQVAIEKQFVKKTTGKKKNSLPVEKDIYAKQDLFSDKTITKDKSVAGNGKDKPVKKTGNEDQSPVNENTTQPVAVINDVTPDLVKTDSVVTGIATRETTAADTAAIAATTKTDSVTTTTAARKKPARKIKWAIEAGVGVSGVQGDAFSLTANRDRLYAAAPSLPTNAITNGFPSPYHPPSEVRNGPAFRIAVSGELKVSKRSSFSAGLQYSYISNRMQVGSKADTAITITTSQSTMIRLKNIYDAGGQQEGYSNKYHFLQVPLTYHLQLNRSTRMPLTLNLGASVSYLFATNALIYDQSAGGFYYKDKTAYNRLHFGLGGGLSLGFKGKSGREWSIGPDYLIDLTRQMKSAQFDGRYFFYGGIHAKWYLSK